MGDGFQFLDILLFAMVAGFLVLRLRSVLGKRTGHQRPRPDPISQGRDEPAGAEPARPAAAPGNGADAALLALDDPVAAGVARIRAVDPSFDRDEFADGARAAFEMIVQAFADGDAETLGQLLSKEVLENFSDAIEQRAEAGRELETTIIGIKSVEIAAADMQESDAVVAVRFVSEQVNVTRDSEERVVEGDPNQIMEITDVWTFSRDARSRDPNWRLVETRSET